MRKLGLIGRWQQVPASGEFTVDGNGVRQVAIRFNTMDRVLISIQESDREERVRAGAERGEESSRLKTVVPGDAKPLGVVEGLEEFEFRASLPAVIKVHPLTDGGGSVFFSTDAGQNYTIDAEHLRDFTVPMIGRRERNAEMDMVRFEMRQQMREFADMFEAFRRERAVGSVDQGVSPSRNGSAGDSSVKSAKNEVSPEPESDDASGAEAGAASGNVRGRSGSDAGRSISEKPEVQRAAAASGEAGGSPGDTGV